MQPMKPAKIQRPGNAEVVDMLRKWLDLAENGRLAFAVVVACESNNYVISNNAGDMRLAFAANWGLDTAKYQLMVRNASYHEEAFSPRESADRVCWNISEGPACFDFIAWLVIAEMNRRRMGAPFPLKVGFCMKEGEEERRKQEGRQKFYDNVIYPGLSLVGAVHDPESNTAQQMERYTFVSITERAKRGEEVPTLTPSEKAVRLVKEHLKGDRPVTITLREIDFLEHRNCNVAEWLKVADHLKAQGERVIIVRDTSKANEELPGYETYPAASIDLHTRVALYDQAKCNLSVTNGPWSLVLFGRAPWLAFIEPQQVSTYFPDMAQFWQQWHGIDPFKDEQFPWCSPAQRIIWKRDDAENIIDAWEKVRPLLNDTIAEAAE